MLIGSGVNVASERALRDNHGHSCPNILTFPPGRLSVAGLLEGGPNAGEILIQIAKKYYNFLLRK